MVVSANACGHARGIGDAQRRHAGSGLDQQRIDVAVIAAFELDGQIAAGESARDAQRAHGGFGAGIDQAHHLHRRNDLRRSTPPVRLRCPVGAPKLVPISSALRSASITGCGTMAQNQRSPGADVIDIRLPSTSKMREPSPRAMNSGVPPTPRKARTGELTPPGMRGLRPRKQLFGFAMSS